MRSSRFGALMALAAMLSGCGGGGAGSSAAGAPTPTPTATPAATCSLRDRQNWAAGQLREWYLFPETLPASLDPTPYTSVDTYIDALTATARSQRKDRYFTYLTSIAEENAFYASGSSAGFGIRLVTDAQRRVFITEAFEGAPALAAGIDRGAQIVAIGTNSTNLRTVADIIAAEGAEGVTTALGPTTAGTTRLLRITDAAGTRDIAVTKTDYALPPVSSRYGAKVIDDGGRQVGYVNLRTFISTAEPGLRQAFATFRARGITEVIVDLRYNGGGLISVAELFADLMGRNRAATDVVDYVAFRPEKAAENSTRFFLTQPESIAPTRLAFIGLSGTASASELVINSFVPFLGNRAALIGANTYGKPVGQIALDRAACDDRLRVVALAIQNAARVGDYYDGLASRVGATCQAADDYAHPLGDPQETSTRVALDFLAGRGCSPITAGVSAGATASAERFQSGTAPAELLVPAAPSPAQREVPGLY